MIFALWQIHVCFAFQWLCVCVGGGTGFSIAFRLSICHSVEKWLLHGNSISHICWQWPKEDLYWFWGSKAQRSKSDFKLCTISTQLLFYLLTCNNDTSHKCCLWPEEDVYQVLILGSRGQKSKLDFVFELCTVSAPLLSVLLTYNNDTSLLGFL